MVVLYISGLTQDPVWFSLVYVFDMTPCESFLHCNNGSSTFKQLALMAFLLLQYIYIIYMSCKYGDT